MTFGFAGGEASPGGWRRLADGEDMGYGGQRTTKAAEELPQQAGEAQEGMVLGNCLHGISWQTRRANQVDLPRMSCF